MHNPFKVVEMFEENLAEYTGAPYVVTTDNCTDAIFLALKYHKKLEASVDEITIPARTYLSVPQSIIQAGYKVKFVDYKWEGFYRLNPLFVWDSSKRFTSDMWKLAPPQEAAAMMCLSFHHKKILNIGKGGAILTNNKEAAEWLRRARYEGRASGVSYHQDDIIDLGWNMYMTPEQAARGMTLLSALPKHNPNQIEDPDYRDLREFTAFKE